MTTSRRLGSTKLYTLDCGFRGHRRPPYNRGPKPGLWESRDSRIQEGAEQEHRQSSSAVSSLVPGFLRTAPSSTRRSFFTSLHPTHPTLSFPHLSVPSVTAQALGSHIEVNLAYLSKQLCDWPRSSETNMASDNGPPSCRSTPGPPPGFLSWYPVPGTP